MSESSDSEVDADMEDLDSDAKLQEAFADGRLKPGLNRIVGTKKAARARKPIYNTAGMENILSEFQQNLDLPERLDVLNDLAPETENMDDLDVHDDFKREMIFYRQAQAAVLLAIPRLHQLGVATKPPDDYFAEMAKGEQHMHKVREKLLSKKIGMERSERAKKLREQKKLGKLAQQNVQQKRQKDKKELMESVKKFKKGNKNALDFLDDESTETGRNQPRRDNKRHTVNEKRNFRNEKFGFGGRKKRSKYNTAESSSKMSSFPRRGGTAGKKGRNVAVKRLGKSRRQNMKQRNMNTNKHKRK